MVNMQKKSSLEMNFASEMLDKRQNVWNIVRKCKVRQYFGQKYIKKNDFQKKKRKEMKFVVSWGGP